MTEMQTATTAFDVDDAAKSIQRLTERYTRAHVDGDVATIDALFTRDATSMPPGADALVGRAVIHDLTVAYVAGGVTRFHMESVRCYGGAELLVDEGTYVMTYGPGDTTERGKYLNVWKPEDGAWRIHANIWNASS